MATKMHLLTRLSQSFTRLPAISGRVSVSRGLARTYSTPSNSETPASKEEPKKEDEKESSGPPPIAILIAGGLGIYLGFALSNSGKKDKINAEARSSGTIKVPESADYADIGGKKGEEIEKEYGKEVKDKQAVYIVEKITNRPIPTDVTLPSGHRGLLLGYGAKRVTFLQIAVYAASFYADEETVRNWTELAERKIAEDDVVKGLLDGEVCVRIEPVRDTTGPHLYNALNRHLLPTLPKPLPPALSEALNEFNGLFPRTLPAGSELLMIKSGVTLTLQVDGRILGFVANKEIADGIVWGYLKSEGANVPEAREKLDEVAKWMADR